MTQSGWLGSLSEVDQSFVEAFRLFREEYGGKVISTEFQKFLRK